MGGKIPSSVESRHEKIAMGSKLVIRFSAENSRGSEGNEILSSNYVEVGIQLPKALGVRNVPSNHSVGWVGLVGWLGWLKLMEVPGLTNIMEYFVKNYGTQSGIPKKEEKTLGSHESCFFVFFFR